MSNRLSRISTGSAAYVEAVNTVGGMRARLMDIGLTRGARVACLYSAPSGDPRAYWIRGAVIALRQKDADSIVVREGGEGAWD